MNKEIKDLQDNLAVADTENKVLVQKLKKLETELGRFTEIQTSSWFCRLA